MIAAEEKRIKASEKTGTDWSVNFITGTVTPQIIAAQIMAKHATVLRLLDLDLG